MVQWNSGVGEIHQFGRDVWQCMYHLFQNKGAVDVKDDRALSSTSSITKFAIVTDTGDPIAVPCLCW